MEPSWRFGSWLSLFLHTWLLMACLHKPTVVKQAASLCIEMRQSG